MGKIQVENLSGGLYRSSTPTQIPEISFSDMSGYDIEDNSIVTRKGATRYNTNPFYPGCVKFGPSSTQRAQFLLGNGGSYWVATPATTQNKFIAFALYAKELTPATTQRRAIMTITSKGGTSLARLYFSTAGKLELASRANSSISELILTQDQSTGDTIARPATTCPSNLFYGRIQYDGTGGGVADWIVTLRNYKKTISWAFNSSAGAGTSVGYNLILGCDANISYPQSDWSNAANKAFYGYMGEVVVIKNAGNSDPLFEDMKTSPGRRIEDAYRVAYYPLQKDYDDAWGISPSLGSYGFQTGSGLGNYSVLDPKNKDARHLLNVTKSWHIDTFGDTKHVYGLSTTLSARYRNYINSVGSKSAWTFDVIPVKWGATSADFPLLQGTTCGPYIRLSRNGADKTNIKFTHRVTTAVTIGSTYSINNQEISKITCQYRYSAATANGQIRIFHNTMLMTSTSVAVAGAATAPGHIQFGTNNTTSVSCEAYVSGFVLHRSTAGNAWGNRPQETYGKITTYSQSSSKPSFFAQSGFSMPNMQHLATRD